MSLQICDGHLLDQNVDAIVNAWNRNLFPWWLLLPQGVSAAIKRRAGYTPFRELSRYGLIPLGGAVETSAGRLNCKAIIHVAGINLLWRSSESAIRNATQNALKIAEARGYRSIAFPIVGAGTGGFDTERSLRIMTEAAQATPYEGEIIFVRYRPNTAANTTRGS